MKRFTRVILPILIAVVLSGITPILAMAATTSTVTVTFTPQSLVAGVTTPNSWAIGFVADSATAQTATGYFSTANTSNCVTDWAISCGATWTGGTAFTHSDTATAGADTVGLKASPNTGAFDKIIKNTSPVDVATSVAASTAVVWEAKFYAPTSHSDAVQKTNTIVMTVRAH
jgi:hypothetical protein